MRHDKGLVLQDLDCLFRRGTAPSGDGALLDSFLSQGDESAFEALVRRHGPMVRGVCRRLLKSPQDADDAFQATFLALVRKGGRLRDPDRLGPWLHGVATREALKARSARRDGRAVLDVPSREGADPGAEWSDVMPIIDAELARLPAKHREVLVVCLLNGATVEEASRRLDCPVGTVKSRLSRAREALRARLTSRGVAPAVAVAALSADASAFASPASSTLIRATLAVATPPAPAPGAASFITGVATTMISKSTLSVLVIVGLGVAGLATVTRLHSPQAQGQQATGDRPHASSASSATDETSRQAANLKEILLASVNYETAEGSYPPPAIYGDGSRPLLSWRVAILPFLGQGELYREFRQNEPWDSPHNKALIDRMPAVFETPAAPAPRGYTRFRGVAGEGSVFDPKIGSEGAAMASGMMGGMMGGRGMTAEKRGTDRRSEDGRAHGGAGGRQGPEPATKPKDASATDSGEGAAMGMMSGMMASPPARGRRGVNAAEVTDGTANTVFVVVARDATPWTKPGELPFVPDQELPALDDHDPRGYLLGFCHGNVRLLKKDQPAFQPVLTALITRAGGEIVSSDGFADTGRPAAADDAAAKSKAAEAGSPRMEERLRAVEEKLDQLLQRLDAK